MEQHQIFGVLVVYYMNYLQEKFYSMELIIKKCTPKQQDFDDMGLHQIKQSLKVVKPCKFDQFILDKTTREFILRMLQYSPIKRATAEELLKDKFFQPLYQCKNLLNNQDKTEQMKQLIMMKQTDNEYLSQETIDYINKQQNIK